MSELPEVERDALQVAEALAGLIHQLAAMGFQEREAARFEHDGTRVMWALAEEGSAAAERVLEYLRGLRGPGDGVATAYPPRLGLWRDWVPPRGDVLRRPDASARYHESAGPVPNQAGGVLPSIGHGDPGE